MAKKPKGPARETDLYEPVHDFLVAQGYTVRAEVNNCDITATRGDDLIVIELKRRFDLKLFTQATERQRITDSVYVALPAPGDMGPRGRWPGMKRLLRQLELGLILVFLDSPQPRVEVVFHPLPYQRQKRKRARRAVLAEMAGRGGGRNVGGSSRRKLVTAYREMAIHIACCLEKHGPLAPRRLREMGTGPKTTSILYDNHYCWFERVDRGVYALSARGREELAQYPDLAASFRDMA